MIIKKLKLKSFRCFSDLLLDFDSKCVVFEGGNGTGKTTILEALYYACYLRSSRTRLNRELVRFEKDHFFLQVNFKEEFDLSNNSIQIGYSNKEGKIVKLNNKSVTNFQEIISRYKIINLSQDDMQLVVGAPEFRRAYLNQSLFLLDSKMIVLIKEYKKILEQRNRFLALQGKKSLLSVKKDELFSWTEQLWKRSIYLQKQRMEFLKKVEVQVNEFLKKYFYSIDNSIFIELTYLRKSMKKNYIEDLFENFWKFYEVDLLKKELQWQRTLFGVHLDDFSINFKNKKARFFASRGQQKLILFLLKLVQLLAIQENETGVFLLDDFLTDFDINRLISSVSLLQDQNFQFFITSPIKSFIKSRILNKKIDLQIHSLK